MLLQIKTWKVCARIEERRSGYYEFYIFEREAVISFSWSVWLIPTNFLKCFAVRAVCNALHPQISIINVVSNLIWVRSRLRRQVRLTVSIKHRLRTTDCRLRTGYKTGSGIKRGLSITDRQPVKVSNTLNYRQFWQILKRSCNLRLALRNGTKIDRSIIDYSSLIHIVAVVRNIQIHVGFELCNKRLNFCNRVLC